jgi:hypothetical protein
MTRRAGTPGSFTSSETGGSSRDPLLPWGFYRARKTFWRLPVLYSTRYRHTRQSRKFSESPPRDAHNGRPLRTSLPCHRTIKELSTRAVFSSRFSHCAQNCQILSGRPHNPTLATPDKYHTSMV